MKPLDGLLYSINYRGGARNFQPISPPIKSIIKSEGLNMTLSPLQK